MRVLLIAITSLAACGGGTRERPEPDAGPPPDFGAVVFEVGTGNDVFEPIEPGGELRIADADQGCCHIWLAFRYHGPDLPRMRVSYGIRDAETGALVSVPDLGVPVDLEDARPWAGVSGLVGFLDRPAEEVAGRVVTLFADGADAGLHAEATAPVSTRLP